MRILRQKNRLAGILCFMKMSDRLDICLRQHGGMFF